MVSIFWAAIRIRRQQLHFLRTALFQMILKSENFNDGICGKKPFQFKSTRFALCWLAAPHAGRSILRLTAIPRMTCRALGLKRGSLLRSRVSGSARFRVPLKGVSAGLAAIK
jgi:hypothetical protein